MSPVGEALGLSGSVGLIQLAGRRRPHPSLTEVARALAGSNAAGETASLLHKEARL